MLEMFKQNPRFIIGAIVVHLFFIVLFGLGFHFKSKDRGGIVAPPKTIEVTTVDERLVKKELDKLKARDDREAKRQKNAIKKRKAEERKLKDLEKKRIVEQEKEKQRIALMEQQEKDLKKKQKKLKEKQAKEQKRLDELEKKRKTEEVRQDRATKEKELKENMLAEDARMKQEQEANALRQAELKKRQTLIDKYMNLIELKVYQNWIVPPNASRGLVSELRVKLIPTGDVIDVQLSKSSGDAVYDKSVQAAVKRASPLPLPPAESGLFDTFRDLRLPMRADKKT